MAFETHVAILKTHDTRRRSIDGMFHSGINKIKENHHA
jgi:hypothetical protein